MNNPNNIRGNMPPMQNGPPYHQQQRNMMMPPQHQQQQYMNNPMQQQPNMMMNRQQPMQYPGQAPSYPPHHHMPPQNFNNGMAGGQLPPQYNVPPGVMPQQPPFMNKHVPPFNGIPSQQSASQIIPGQQMAPNALIPNTTMMAAQPPLKPSVPHSISLPMLSEAEFYSYKERLKKE